MSKHLAKPFLWLMTAIVPVFIAACYGSVDVVDGDDDGYDDTGYALNGIAGRVLSALTGSGIPYIRVTCLRTLEGALEECEDVYSGPGDGAFELWVSEEYSCEQLKFEDVDGEDNGTYATLILDYAATDEDIVAELEPAE